jgi:outer membrane usher protein
MGLSLPLPRSRRAHNLFGIGVLLGILGLTMGAARAEPNQSLQLEVFINDVSARIISTFIVLADGKLAAARSELEELGLTFADSAPGSNALVRLDEVTGLNYEYEERTQRIRITIDPARLRPQRVNLRPGAGDYAPGNSPTACGGVLNYNLFSARTTSQDIGWSATSGSTLSMDARAFSPYGTLQQSGYLLAASDRSIQWVRLETAYHDSDPDHLLTWFAGDTIEGGLPWTRPIRLAGLQWQTNFALRPDLITMPLPSLGGVATVPSTLDIYVNNVKTYSQQIAPGPYSVSNIPLVSGAGDVSLVLRTAGGEETRSSVPLYASPALLAPGLESWSIEAGFPRLRYGSVDSGYLPTLVGSATWRRGIFDWLTGEAHAETGAGLVNSGAGLAARLDTIGVISAALSESTLGSARGGEWYGAYETQLGDLRLNATVEHSVARYEDLASATARLDKSNLDSSLSAGGASELPGQSTSATWAALYTSALPARTLLSLTAGLPLPFGGGSNLSVNDLRLIDGSGNRLNPITILYSRTLPRGATLSASAFQDEDNHRNAGFSIGISILLGASVSGMARMEGGQDGSSGTLEAVRSLGPSAGDFGWRLRDSEGAFPYREAIASYRSGIGVLDIGANQGASGSSALIQLSGAVSTLGGEVFASDRIDDAFAVVQTGLEGIEVFNSNQPIGVTDSRGMLLVPSLRAYQVSLISIDPSGLPPDAELPTSRELVAPADRAGVVLPFLIRRDAGAAIVEFRLPDGQVMPPGAAGQVEGGDDFVVGYDGAAFIRHLKAKNVAKISQGRTICRADFDFAPQPGEQVRIEAVVCR